MKPPKPELRHITLLLHAYIEREGINVSELGRRVGGRTASLAHPWVHGQLCPSPAYREKLAALLKIDEAELLPREGGAVVTQPRALPPAEAEVRALEAHLRAPLPAQVMSPRKPAPDVLSYAVSSDGQAELRVMARGPHVHLVRAFRILLDAGLTPGGEEQEDAA